MRKPDGEEIFLFFPILLCQIVRSFPSPRQTDTRQMNSLLDVVAKNWLMAWHQAKRSCLTILAVWSGKYLSLTFIPLQIYWLGAD